MKRSFDHTELEVAITGFNRLSCVGRATHFTLHTNSFISAVDSVVQLLLGSWESQDTGEVDTVSAAGTSENVAYFQRQLLQHAWRSHSKGWHCT